MILQCRGILELEMNVVSQRRNNIIVRCEDVVAELTQALNHGITAILVSIQSGHCLCFRRLLDGLLNLLTMGSIIGLGGFQIRRR
jgi:hypothetical protein